MSGSDWSEDESSSAVGIANLNDVIVSAPEDGTVSRARAIARSLSISDFSYDTSSVGRNEYHNDAGQNEQKTTRFIWRLKNFIRFGLVASLTIAAIVVYFVVSEMERQNFMRRFDDQANIVFGTVGTTLRSAMSATDSISVAITSFARYTNATFPLEKIPDFAAMTAGLLQLSKARHIALYQLVQKETPEGRDGTSDAHPRAGSLLRSQYSTTASLANRTKIKSYVTNESLPFLVDDKHAIIYPFGFDGHKSEPGFSMAYPVIERPRSSSNASHVVGTLEMDFDWKAIFEESFLMGASCVTVVVSSKCRDTSQSLTFVLGEHPKYLGSADLHDKEYTRIGKRRKLSELTNERVGVPLSSEYCPIDIVVYPTQGFEFEHGTEAKTPLIIAIVVVCIFAIIMCVFVAYDLVMDLRQRKLMKTAEQSTALISTLFPETFRKRLFSNPAAQPLRLEPQTRRLQSFLNSKPSEGGGNDLFSSRPIADLFPETTVLMADIAGFTAWSSVREPFQVFNLLECIYSAFDAIALKRGVFKVETIGDSYVAVAGLPEPNPTHAVVMCRFARDCRQAFIDCTRELEVSLGPGTTNLTMRFGMHSGAVTAGVLRGQRSRFQLFGDTINTAARMESNGADNKIQISQDTADELIKHGKKRWLTKREDLVEAKGKGRMQCYWVEPPENRLDSEKREFQANSMQTLKVPELKDESLNRLAEWSIDLWSRMIKQIISAREAEKKLKQRKLLNFSLRRNSHSPRRGSFKDKGGSTGSISNPILEVKEIIELPVFKIETEGIRGASDCAQLNEKVELQLRNLIVSIAKLYRENPFHSFEHASHVAMSAAKLLGRIVAPSNLAINSDQLMHDHTFGITSDPLTQFAVVFSAFVHDIDHSGVPNVTLVREGKAVAKRYNNKSVAEQNSVDMAWSLFMQPKYSELRQVICATDEELSRFRQLVINGVMATDIVDKDLKNLRNDRWDRAFSAGYALEESQCDTVNRKATIVIEHLLQASDVAHTMQHWQVYIKWNEKLFHELYNAYSAGRIDNDPSEGDSWYKGEIGFFDYYVIPLTKKLADCGVFGVTSDECLQYAKLNREEWERRGRDIVSGYVAKYVKAAKGSESSTTLSVVSDEFGDRETLSA